MDVIQRIEHFDSFDAAVADCVRVLGFTARRRAAKLRLIDPQEAARELLDAARRRPGRARLRSRRQRLPNEILDRVHAAVTIPTTDHASLNLAQAVLIALYELHLAAADATRDPRAAAQGRAAADRTSNSSCYFADAATRSTRSSSSRRATPSTSCGRCGRSPSAPRPTRASSRCCAPWRIEVDATSSSARRSSVDVVEPTTPHFSTMPFRRFFDARREGRARARAIRDRRRPFGRGGDRRGAKSLRRPANHEVPAEHDEAGLPRPRARRCSPPAPRPAANVSRRSTAPPTPWARRTSRPRRRLPRHRRRRQRVPRLHDGARLRRARLRRAERHARRRRRHRGRQRVARCRAGARWSSPSGCAASIPCADKVQFLKTGAEAIAAAVRIARTYTARDVVVACGYFGWLDWSRGRHGGRAAGTRGDFRRVPFDDVAALEAAVAAAGSQLAAIVHRAGGRAPAVARRGSTARASSRRRPARC